MAYASVNDDQFDRQVSLREAYRLMEKFCAQYLERGDTSISDFLYAYAGELPSGQTTDPAAIYDFLEVAETVLRKEPGLGQNSGEA